jgi:hypothetical protein
MTVSRREMLRAGAWAGVALLVPAAEAQKTGLFEPSAESYGDRLFTMTRSAFQSYVGNSFSVRRAGPKGRSIALRLSDVSDLPSAVNAGTEGREDCFALTFVGSALTPLAQATYQMDHRLTGPMKLFLVPTGRPSKVRLYTAIINHQA